MENLIISARNMELTDAIKTYVNDKVSKFDYLLERATEVKAELTESIPHDGVDKDFTVEFHADMPQAKIYIKEKGADLYAIIDKGTDTLARKLKRYKEKLRQWEGEDGWEVEYLDNLADSVDLMEEEFENYKDFIPKVGKQIDLSENEPMRVAQAIEMMELSGRDAFMFKNDETGKWTTVVREMAGYKLYAGGKY